jgi:hypothetical protein
LFHGPGTLELFPSSDVNSAPTTSRQHCGVCHGILNTKKPSIYGNLIEDSLILIQVQSSEGNNSVIKKLKLLIAIIFSLRFYRCNLFLSFMISWYTNYCLDQWRANKLLGHQVTAMWQGGRT